MRKPLLLSLAATLLAAPPLLWLAEAAQAQAAAQQTLSYGTDPLQRISFWPGAHADAPLVVFVHGGGWKRGDMEMMEGSAKLEHWNGDLGYAVASVNYRLVPQATVEQQAGDLAEAVALLKRDSASLGFDGSRIALTGHSAGAHLVALVGTDPQWLAGAGLSFADIAGVLSREVVRAQAGGKLYAESLANILAVHLLRNYSSRAAAVAATHAPAPPPSHRSRAVADAIAFIQANYAREVKLEDVAAAVHLSPFHLARLFKQVSGQSPHQYLVQVRVNAARSLLSAGSGQRSLAEVAAAVGFSDQSHLTRQFKRHFGVTPSQLR